MNNSTSEVFKHFVSSSGNPPKVERIRQPHFGKFSDSVIGIGATAFSPMYAHVFKQHWNNQFYARMKRNYYYSSFEDGVLEYYIPTFMDPERNMKYHRIVIATVPQLDKETLVSEAEKHLATMNISPAGIVDSTTVFVVSPRLSRRGFIRSRKLRENSFACPIITGSPEIALKRILKILETFYTKRIKAMLSAFNLDSCLSNWLGSLSSTLLYTINVVLDRINGDIANGLRCILHSLNWFKFKLKEIVEQVAKQTNIMRLMKAIQPFQPLFNELKTKRNSFELNSLIPLLVALTSVGRLKGGGE